MTFFARAFLMSMETVVRYRSFFAPLPRHQNNIRTNIMIAGVSLAVSNLARWGRRTKIDGLLISCCILKRLNWGFIYPLTRNR